MNWEDEVPDATPIDWDAMFERACFWVIGIGFGYIAAVVVMHVVS